MGNHHAADDDHWDLFDEADGAAAGPLTGGHSAVTGELDLGELREVLAGRRSADEVQQAAAQTPPRRRRTRRRHPVRSTIIAVLVMALIAAGVIYGVVWWRQSTAEPQDWAGTGAQVTVVRVLNGDGLYDIGRMLVDSGVVADVAVFVAAAGDDGRLSALAPGYYRVHEHSSAKSVVDDLANPDNRLGQLRVIPGQILADLTVISTTGEKTVKPGIISTIADACVPNPGQQACFTVDELWQAAKTEPLNQLGIVGWADSGAAAAPDARRRLEGLILPGDYDIAPGSTARQALEAVVQASAARWNTTGITAAAATQGVTPYQLATIASLVQAEGIGPDMRKVSRVIDNRLDIGMKLQFDSTVNYGLDRAQISTTNAERLDQANLYSTYAHAGLPPTPIGAPGPQALDAADDPATGDWLYFVAIDLEGNSCFSVTFADHEKCVDQARDNGVFG